MGAQDHSTEDPLTKAALSDPAFADMVWRMTPASMAVRLSRGRWVAWDYLQLLSRKLVDVAMGKCRRLIVVMPPRHGKATSNKSRVTLSNGSQKLLGDIVVGDVVATHGGRGRRVLEIFEHSCKECVAITTKTGRIVVAEISHPMFTSIGEQRASDVRIGQGLAILRNFEASRMSERSLPEFRILGYLIGDGCMTGGNAILARTDSLEREDFCKCLDSIGSTYRITADAVYCHKAGQRWTRSSGIADKGAYHKSIPEWAFAASNDQICNLLGAYLATDGSVSDPKTVRKSDLFSREGQRVGCTVEYCSVSKLLLQQVQHLLSRLDVASRLRPKKGTYRGAPHHSWRLIITDRRSLLNFIDQVPVHHSVKRSHLSGWREILVDHPSVHPQLTIDQISEVRDSKLSYVKLSAKFNTGEHVLWNIKHDIGCNLPHSELYFYDQVVKLERTREDCRCLTVDEDHTFICNDFVVHNSELISHWFPVWMFNTMPRTKIILASYESDFAAKWGGKVRDTIMANQDTLDVRLKSRQPAMQRWLTTEDGEMNCAGIGGPITGRGANGLIIDDFVKNRQEAKSRTVRETNWEWFTSTAYTRLEPAADGGQDWAIVMATRWDVDDIIGRAIDVQYGSEKGLRLPWEVFCLPAIADPEPERHYLKFGVVVNNVRPDSLKPASASEYLLSDSNPEWRDIIGRGRGRALCPDRYDEKDLALIRGTIGEVDWASLYQQTPGSEVADGNVYHAFDEFKNCRPLSYDPNLPLFVSLDFNINPMTAVIGQYDPGIGIRLTERIHILEELFLQKSNTFAMTERLVMELQKYKRGYLLKVEIYGDVAGSQKSANSSKTNWQIVAEVMAMDSQLHPLFLRRKANPNIVDRVNAVNSMLKSADGSIRMLVDDRRCPRLVDDFKKVRYDEDSGGNSTGLLDKSNHMLTHVSDALGYAVDFRFGMRPRSGAKKGMVQ